jgi:hypothetical protein
VLYVATGMSGGLAYGTSVLDSVVNSIQTKWIQQVANMVIVLHCLMTLPLYINTLNQEVEDAMGVPQGVILFLIELFIMFLIFIFQQFIF